MPIMGIKKDPIKDINLINLGTIRHTIKLIVTKTSLTKYLQINGLCYSVNFLKVSFL